MEVHVCVYGPVSDMGGIRACRHGEATCGWRPKVIATTRRSDTRGGCCVLPRLTPDRSAVDVRF
eukprot:3664160-Rhodomonas_salina.3